MREPGFYWVKLAGEWEVAHWCESWRGYNQWSYCGHDLFYDDDIFEEIDENRIT